MEKSYRIGLVGARGYTGKVLLGLIAEHPHLDLVFAGSRDLAGTRVSSLSPAFDDTLKFQAMNPEDIGAYELDIVILATPDGAAAPYVQAIEALAPGTVIIDLSADYRFDEQWQYGLPELQRLYGRGDALVKARRIANPGCYATAMQLAIAPLLRSLNGVPSVFGVSGFSGAGTKPSPRNNVERLAENLLPYALTGHNHEREASRHLNTRVRFTPHVHPALRGIITTVHVPLKEPMERAGIRALYDQAYGGEPLIKIQDDAPELKNGTGNNGVIIGGFGVSTDCRHVVVVAAEDNLLKGAGVQAMQNVNLALGLPELTGITSP